MKIQGKKQGLAPQLGACTCFFHTAVLCLYPAFRDTSEKMAKREDENE
jgi:hypothetical protein